ncbi:hypothetical protein BKH03_00010 [Actinomyces naeslundii]|nr:hypothetical protein BKH03_00010 [Actinomyces naeslundii]
MAGRSPSEVRLEVAWVAYRLDDCGVVLTELLECHLHLGDGSSQRGMVHLLVLLAGGIHLLLNSALDGRLQRILLAASPWQQTSHAAPRVEGLAR